MRTQASMAVNTQGKIITLWSVFLLGLLFHTQLGLMPLFHGQSVVEPGANPGADISWILWLMLIFFVLPMIAMVVTVFNASSRYRSIHLGLTVLYTVMNFLHIAADLNLKPIAWYQIALMVILFVIGILLNIVSFQWMREGKTSQERLISS